MAIDDELTDEQRAQVRAKLYDFVSDPMNRQNPDVERARRLLGKMSKAQAPEAMSPQPQAQTDESAGVSTGAIHGEMNPNFMASGADKILRADVNDQRAVDTIRGRAHPPSELENDIVAQAIVGDAMARPFTAGLSLGLKYLLGKTTRGGEAANFLRREGEPLQPRKAPFEEEGIFENPTPKPGVAEAQKALEFQAPKHMNPHMLANPVLAPLSLLMMAARNMSPLAGRVGVPIAEGLMRAGPEVVDTVNVARATSEEEELRKRFLRMKGP